MKEVESSSAQVSEPPQEQNNLPELKVNDTAFAYEEETNSDLRKKARLLDVLSSKGKLNLRRTLYKTLRGVPPINRLLSESAYFDFFLGDENLDDSLTQMGWLKDRNVTVIPSLVRTGANGETDIVEAYGETSQSFQFAAEHRNLIPFVMLKTRLLIDDKTFIKYARTPDALNEDEQEEVERFHSRFVSLCRLAYDLDLPVVIEVDNYLCQTVVDEYTTEVMLLFNRHKPIVFAGIDVNRTDVKQRVEALANLAETEDFYAGIMLSEGLANEEDRNYALKNGYGMPTKPLHDKKLLEKQFVDVANLVFEKIEHLALCAYTHNNRICCLLTEAMAQKGIEPDDERVSFVQNYGLSDVLTFALSRGGYNVSKVFPYGKYSNAIYELFQRFRLNRVYRNLAKLEKESIKAELNRR